MKPPKFRRPRRPESYAWLLCATSLFLGAACQRAPDTADPYDEFKQAGLTAQDFRYPITIEKQNFFQGMDVVTPVRARPDQLLDLEALKAGDQPGPRPLADVVH